MDKRELILVCGISGAGKSTTMNYLESAGFYCIDNLPITALLNTLKALKKDDYFYQYAIAINSNASEEAIAETLFLIKSYDYLDVKILFLDVNDEVIIKRFQFTRKSHPFVNANESLLEAIAQERELLKPFRTYANEVLDTSDYTAERLKIRLSKIFDKEITPKFKLSFVSFGFKHGLPRDLDYIFDVRFIPNPYYIEELKNKTGNDQEVYDFVLAQDSTEEFLDKLIPLLDFCIEMHKETNRSYLVIGIGCTGGHHRSVTLANYLASLYEKKYDVIKEHRDVER